MKRTIYLILVILAFTQCRKYPNMDDLSGQFVVYTNYDAAADFKSYQTFVLPDYVGLISNTSQDSILDPQYGDQILASIKSHMEARGYTAVGRDDNPDIGIGAMALKDVDIYTSGWYPGYWWGYPGWGGCWWYYCGWYPYYPPYYGVYVYETGSLIIEMIDLKNPVEEDHRLKVLWTNWNGGALGSTGTNLDNALNSIDQAFTQSPYISAQ
ncbi:DUF4136 domain-containing protein [Flavihumibacter petaseus]|uniref:DUF4136 domain-containing protein n=1 Tax=Flavihumibacter petaseus NBRC 106054 TaxID=1220578 RepID=A0A0E9N3N1_9BACT|nr:DUF4136 domain-containing protein [Flavihumibacter petaseus]GAO43965.1 hypothetical protein FPE01S_03_00040 [Flavihumibacter petaseus NBRC 106054]